MFSVEDGENMRACVEWYWRYHELFQVARKYRPRGASPQEVYLNVDVAFEAEIELETIIGKCQVFQDGMYNVLLWIKVTCLCISFYL